MRVDGVKIEDGRKSGRLLSVSRGIGDGGVERGGRVLEREV